jgi:hypothetical protein
VKMRRGDSMMLRMVVRMVTRRVMVVMAPLLIMTGKKKLIGACGHPSWWPRLRGGWSTGRSRATLTMHPCLPCHSYSIRIRPHRVQNRQSIRFGPHRMQIRRRP